MLTNLRTGQVFTWLRADVAAMYAPLSMQSQGCSTWPFHVVSPGRWPQGGQSFYKPAENFKSKCNTSYILNIEILKCHFCNIPLLKSISKTSKDLRG